MIIAVFSESRVTNAYILIQILSKMCVTKINLQCQVIKILLKRIKLFYMIYMSLHVYALRYSCKETQHNYTQFSTVFITLAVN